MDYIAMVIAFVLLSFLLSCVLCMLFNFIMYENNPMFEGFYTFPEVYLRYNDQTAVQLPAYQNGNYLVNNNKYGSR